MQILHLYISSTPVEKFILDLYTTLCLSLSVSLYIERARTMCNVIILKRIHAPKANIQLERHTRNKKKWNKWRIQKKIYTFQSNQIVMEAELLNFLKFTCVFLCVRLSVAFFPALLSCCCCSCKIWISNVEFVCRIFRRFISLEFFTFLIFILSICSQFVCI